MKEKMQPEEAIEILEKAYIIAARRSGKIQNVKALALAIAALRENAYICSSSSYKELQALRKFKKDNERPTGEWIYDNTLNNWVCNKCFQTPKTIGYTGSREFMIENFKYCNHCGAEMKGAKE